MNAAAAFVAVLGARQPFNPVTSLFAHGEQGVVLDPSDLSTLYQDSAGTTPVTAVEQAVGLILDKSKGLVIGPELVTNGGPFTNTTGWTATNTTLAAVNGELELTATASPGAYAGQTITTVSGKSYRFSGTLRAPSANTGVNAARVRLYTTSALGTLITTPVVTGTPEDTTVSFSFVFVAEAATTFIQLGVASNTAWGSIGDKAYFNNLTIRELAGNHAIQPGATNRPILRSRYNLLTYSEDFSDAAWTKTTAGVGVAPVVTANAGVAPDGTNTADRVQFDCGDASSAANRSIVAQSSSLIPASQGANGAIWLKAYDAGNVGKTVRVAFENFGSPVVHTLTDSWVRVTGSGTTSATPNLLLETRGLNTQQTADVLVWGADLRRANDTYLPYQRIAAATDYDTVGFPAYLAFDGSDDSLYTSSIDFSATDRMTVFAGVTKLSDATQAPIVELGAGTGDGVFFLFAPRTNATADIGWRSRGTATAEANTAASFAAPITTVLTATGDISGDSAILRSNGTEVASSTADQGTGNYANAVLNIGRRNNATLPFNGRLYSLVVRGAQTSAALIQQAERWVAGKQGRAL